MCYELLFYRLTAQVSVTAEDDGSSKGHREWDFGSFGLPIITGNARYESACVKERKKF